MNWQWLDQRWVHYALAFLILGIVKALIRRGKAQIQQWKDEMKAEDLAAAKSAEGTGA